MKVMFPEETNNFYKGLFWSSYMKFWERAKNPNNGIRSKIVDQAKKNGFDQGYFCKTCLDKA